jgi:hypothetical protein
MATVKMDPQYLGFANSLVNTCHEHGVDLTDYAEGLLRLAAEAWFEERPQPSELRSEQPLTNPQMEDLARVILSKALQDPHVDLRKHNNQKVRFNDLLVALADAARKVLEKGF